MGKRLRTFKRAEIKLKDIMTRIGCEIWYIAVLITPQTRSCVSSFELASTISSSWWSVIVISPLIPQAFRTFASSLVPWVLLLKWHRKRKKTKGLHQKRHYLLHRHLLFRRERYKSTSIESLCCNLRVNSYDTYSFRLKDLRMFIRA